jgi:hypothetical protein
MRHKSLILLATVALAGFPMRANAGGIPLGTAGNFAVLAGSSVTNTNTATAINGGDVGAASSITGFPPGTVGAPYTTVTGGGVVGTALSDLTTAYNAAATPVMGATNLTGEDLGGLTLTPGVYYFSSSADLTGTLTLNDEGNSNALFVFQIGSTLTTAAGSPTSFSSVVTINGGSMPGCNVFWQVGSSATIGTYTAFQGHILAYASITLDTGATILDGSALAMTGAVTLDDNTITNCVSVSSVPEPSTITLALIGGALLGLPAIGKRLSGRRPRAESRRQAVVPA